MLFVLMIACFSAIVAAQRESPSKAGATVSFPFCSDCVSLNAKPIELPKPIYPPAALAVNVSGRVEVRVYINELGKVVSAEAISGHPFLRAAALEAARASTFEPITMNGKQIQVNGVITYNFGLPSSGEEAESVKLVSPSDIKPSKTVIPKFDGCNCKIEDNERVLVEFRLNLDGTVGSAISLTGHRHLREISRQAVLSSRFRIPNSYWESGEIIGHVYYDFHRTGYKWSVSTNGWNFSTK